MKNKKAQACLAATALVLNGCANALTNIAHWQGNGILDPEPIGADENTPHPGKGHNSGKDSIPSTLMRGTAPTAKDLAAYQPLLDAQSDLTDASDQVALKQKALEDAKAEAAAARTKASDAADALRVATDASQAADAALKAAPNDAAVQAAAVAARKDLEEKHQDASDANNYVPIADDNVHRAGIELIKAKSKETIMAAIEQDQANQLAAERYTTPDGVGAISPNSAFFKLQYDSSDAPTDSAKAIAYLNSGVSMSNYMCERWFHQLGASSVTLNQTGDTLSALGSLTTVIMGAAETSPKTLGLVGGLFGFGKASLDSVEANYILSADLAEVHRSVTNYRATYAASILVGNTYDFQSALQTLTAYDNTCSQLGVKTFITRQVASGSEQKPVKNPESEFEDQALKTFAAKYASQVFAKKPDGTDIVPLYAYLVLASADQKKTLAAGAVKPFLTDGTTDIAFADKQSAQTFQSMLSKRGVLGLVSARAEAYLAALPAKAAEQPAVTEAQTPADNASGTPVALPETPPQPTNATTGQPAASIPENKS